MHTQGLELIFFVVYRGREFMIPGPPTPQQDGAIDWHKYTTTQKIKFRKGGRERKSIHFLLLKIVEKLMVFTPNYRALIRGV